MYIPARGRFMPVLLLLLDLRVIKPTCLDTVLNYLSVLQGASSIFAYLILSRLLKLRSNCEDLSAI